MDDLFNITNVFAITTGLFFTALGATERDNHGLKTGLSAAGLVVSGAWAWCSITQYIGTDQLPAYAPVVAYLPIPFIFGWLFSFVFHWKKQW